MNFKFVTQNTNEVSINSINSLVIFLRIYSIQSIYFCCDNNIFQFKSKIYLFYMSKHERKLFIKIELEILIPGSCFEWF